ncbi:30S ribosomal protein S3ae [Vulcanisaeta thermophila]|uniref:30S ribosomal protein S3ae n=1 Tax=Vulcanisaeta thermophila TaxID=867917 RepID=UPI0008530531|nr:30S ribosomal protein S3ae [Vulcanisaeta thermophila]
MSTQRQAKTGKWMIKKWFTVYAPGIFNDVEIGEVPANEPSAIINRTMEITLFDITRDLGHLHIKLRFQINNVEGDKASTVFKGMELTRDYIKSLIRRGSSLIQLIQDVTTRDNALLRITVLAMTPTRCKSSQKRAIRKAFMEELSKMGPKLSFDEFIKAAVFGDVNNQLFTVGKKIYPLRKVEVYKIKVLRYPTTTQGAAQGEVKVAEAQPTSESSPSP